MKKLLGKYTGIVVENSGYQRDGSYIPGTVLVKVDGITPRRFTERYKGIPSYNVGGTLDKEMVLSYAVPAYIMSPIIGESSMGKYQAASNKSDISDVTTDATGFGSSKIPLKPPCAQFDIMNKHCRDKMSDGPAKHSTTINNPDGNSYFPDHRYKAGKGIFAIPEINSRVIVEFINGSQSFPVIVGKLNTSDEIEGYYNADGTKPDYPFIFQNDSTAGNNSEETDSLVDEFRDISDKQIDITRNLAESNLTETQRSQLLVRGKALGSRGNDLVDRANDSQLNRISGISAETQYKVADILLGN